MQPLRRLLPLAFFLLACLMGSGASFALAPDTRTAVEMDLRSGHADDALRRLEAAVGHMPEDAEAHTVFCRVYYGEERWDDALRECQQAVALDPRSSNAHLWLGRAEGEKADRVSFVSAYALAKKIHVEFETAVAIDPANTDALSDLGEFYTEAPGIVGGGISKAQAVAAKLDSHDHARAEELRGRIAAARKDPAAAEQHFRASIAAARQPASAWMVLASFYAHRGELGKMETALRAGIAVDSGHSAALVGAAQILIRTQHNPQLASQLLESYLASPQKSEDEPAFRVHALLGHVLETEGNSVGAQQQYAEAASIASGYRLAGAAPTHSGR